MTRLVFPGAAPVRAGVLVSLIGVAALSRLLPHPPNFTPILAMGLAGGVMFGARWVAFVVPLLALLLSDLALQALSGNGFYSGQWVVYLAVAGVCWLGTLTRVTVSGLIGSSVLASVGFFLVSNLGVWLSGTLYPATGAGLVACYVAAIPFLGNTLVSTLLYGAVLFAGCAVLRPAGQVISIEEGQR